MKDTDPNVGREETREKTSADSKAIVTPSLAKGKRGKAAGQVVPRADKRANALVLDLSQLVLDYGPRLPSVDALAFAKNANLADHAAAVIALRLINRDHAVVPVSGSTRVARITTRREPITIGTTTVTAEERSVKFLRRSDFLALFEGASVLCTLAGERPRVRTLGETWLACKTRRQYGAVTFEPGNASTDETLNVWRGWRVKPVPGDWANLRAHILDNLCCGDAKLNEWLLDWLAHMVQQPMAKPGTAIVLRGRKGTGKSKLAEWLAYALGYSVTVTQPEQLTGRFTGHLANRLLVVAEESTWGGDKHSVGALNMLITSPTLTLEKKGVDAMEMKSCHRLMIISNSDWIVPATADERRYCVLDVGSDRMQDRAYFAVLDKQMFDGGAEAMLHALKTRKITHDVGVAPRTAALGQQIAQGVTDVQSVFVRLAADGVIRNRKGEEVVRLADHPSKHVSKAAFFELIDERANRGVAPRQVGELLKATGVVEYRPQRQPRALIFPPEDEFIARVEAFFGGVSLDVLAGGTDEDGGEE